MIAVGAPPVRKLTMTEGRTLLCGHRCLLEFQDDPEPFLDPAYVLIM